MRDVFTKSVAAIPQPVYVASNQYGNREYPPPQGGYKTNLKGCYWDGKPHGRDSCEELQRAINRGEVHQKGKVLYLGQEGVGDSIRVAVPVEIDGKVTWQQEWVREQLLKKESSMPRANFVTFEEDQDEQEIECQLIREEINGIPVVFLATEEADVEGKRGRPIEDVGEKENKRPRTREPVKRSPRTNKRALTVPPNRATNKEKLWATLRESVNLEELSKRTLDACRWGSGCFVWTSTSTSVPSRNRRGSSTNYHLGVLQWERKRYQCSYYIEVCVLCS